MSMVGEFTDRLEADDWKDAAAVVGLIRFFDYAQIPYNKEEIDKARETYDDDSEYDEGLDLLKFNAADITDEKLDAFIEDYFSEELHHCAVERALHKTEWSKEEIDFINGKLTANTVMANFKLFSKISLVLCAILRFAQVLMVFKCISLCMLYILARLPDPLCGCLEGGRLYVFPNVRKAMLCPGFSCIHLRSCRQIYGGGSHLPTLLCFPILPACKMRGRRLFSPSV